MRRPPNDEIAVKPLRKTMPISVADRASLNDNQHDCAKAREAGFCASAMSAFMCSDLNHDDDGSAKERGGDARERTPSRVRSSALPLTMRLGITANQEPSRLTITRGSAAVSALLMHSPLPSLQIRHGPSYSLSLEFSQIGRHGMH